MNKLNTKIKEGLISEVDDPTFDFVVGLISSRLWFETNDFMDAKLIQLLSTSLLHNVNEKAIYR